jgi:hypothetical protein
MSTIRADLQLNTSGFLEGMRKVDRTISGFKNQLIGVFVGFAGFNSIFSTIAAGATRVKASLDLGGELADLSASTGMAASELLTLRQAFANAGMESGDLSGNIARLQKALAGTNEEGESTNASLQKLGLAAGQLNGMSAIEQIRALQKAFASITDPIERTQVAMGLFGRKGTKMLALLGDSSALTLAGQQVGALGALMDDNADRFDRISDSINTLSGLKMDQLFAGFAVEVTGSAESMEALSKVDLTGVGSAIARAAANTYNFLGAVNDLIGRATGLKAVGGILEKIGFKTWGDVMEQSQVESMQRGNSSTEDAFAARMADPTDRAGLLNDISQAADTARERLAAVDQEFAGYDPSQIEAVKNELRGHLSVLDAQATALRAVGSAAQQSADQQISAARMTSKEFDQLVEKQKRWVQERQRIAEELPKFRADEELAAAESPEAKRAILTGRAGVDSVAGMDAEIARLEKSLAFGHTSKTGDEIARIKELMDIRRQVTGIDREAKTGGIRGLEKQIGNKQGAADQLLDASRLPQLQTWASAARQIGLGGGASDSSREIGRIQAERQREANGLLKDIRELMKKREAMGATGELVFS